MDIQAIKNDILEKDIISFDIFDTLIIRDFHYPIDVFKYIEDNAKLTDFQKKRINAEITTRSNNFDLADITYESIYKELSEIDINLELDTELQNCILNIDIMKIYNYAISQNKIIVAISDMYLDKEFVQKLLLKNGLDSIHKVYVSGNLNKTKANGELYEHVCHDLDIKPESILHIGDNYHSDYLKAKAKGIKAYHYKALRERSFETYNKYLLESLKEHNTPQSSLFAGLLANNYLQNSRKGYWYQFGFMYAGILLFHFIKHIYDYCRANKITSIYFMARDGKIMKEVFDTLYGHDHNITTHYMLASRRLFFVPSIKDFDDDFLQILTESPQGTTYIDVINKFGFEWLVNNANEYFENIHKVITTKEDRELLKQFFLLYKDKIQDEVIEEKSNLLAYLENIGFLNDNHKLIVDVGWGCSSQKSLESIIQDKIPAIYYGTHKEAYKHELIHGYIFNEGLPKRENDLVLSALPVVELLFVGNHYSVVKFDNSLNPIYHQRSEEEEKRLEIAKSIHNGALDFVKKYQHLLMKYKLLPDESLNKLILTSLLIKPNIEDIIHISKVPHAADVGESSYELIIKNLDQTQREYFTNFLKGDVLKNSSLWPKGKLRYQQLRDKQNYKSIEFLVLLIIKIQRCYSYSFRICVKKIMFKLRQRLL